MKPNTRNSVKPPFYQIDPSNLNLFFMPLSFTSEQKQTVLWCGCGVAFIVLLVLLGPILIPFIAAAILAYILNPAVNWLVSHRIGKFRMPRTLAVVAVLLVLFALLLTLILIVIPVMQKELFQLEEQIPNFLTKLNATLGPKLQEFGIKVRLDGIGIKKMLSQKLATSGDEIGKSVLASVRIGGGAVLEWIANLLLIPIVLFYLLLDWHAMLIRLENAVPRRWIGKITGFAHEVDGLLAQYMHGQLLVMLILAIYYSITLAIAGFDVALPVGIITGLLVFIPYLGFGLGLVLALVAALLQFSGWEGLISVAVIYGIGQVLESFFLTPRMVGERIGLHPLAVIFALLAFGQLFGFAGILLALPVSAIISVALKHLRTYYLNSSFYSQQ
jgi:predicted PurR-regulated permease PerM